MLDRLDAIESGEINLATLVQDLRGLFVEADPRCVDLRQGFEVRWSVDPPACAFPGTCPSD